jgi:FAD/FMN-containing dehydrogenase/Fe-S oxidoreductase
MNPPLAPSDERRPDRVRLARELERIAPSQVRFDRHHQLLYSTDASNYQVEPIGVVIPRDVGTLARLVEFCGSQNVPILPRGGGTSLPGQCVNRAVVLDHSAFCRRVSALDVAARRVQVEPGITIDQLNRWLESQRSGLFFAPDPATSAQAAIGGCIGNNAAGARSIRYGRTSENVEAMDVILTTGERTQLRAAAGRDDAVARRLSREVAAVVREYAHDIRQRFPKTKRRNAGYALDVVLAQIDRGVSDDDLDLTGLICGSEGTLAVVLGATLKLHPVPASKGLAVVSFAGVAEAIDAVDAILRSGPSAVELLDDVVLSAARGNAECREHLRLVPTLEGGEAGAVLYVEYQESGPIETVRQRFAALGSIVAGRPVRTYTDAPSLARLWALRKAGEPLLHGLSEHGRKPVTFIEDNAVPPENLARFVQGVKQIVALHGTTAAYFAHASVGVLHIRPMLDLHDPSDRSRLRDIAVAVADLARQCGGVMSGEHGDGRVRGPLLERFFGPRIMAAFAQVKRIFDPAGLLNPGIVVNAGPIESITQSLRVEPRGSPLKLPAGPTYFDYDEHEGYGAAIELCNGAGVCRKTAVGAMCPSYRATVDERHSTRGRANALRMALSGQIPQADGKGSASPPAWNDRDTIQTLDLCLSCKACKSECPSNVDLARLKAEYTAQRYRRDGVPLAAQVFGRIRLLNRLGSLAPSLANRIANARPVRAVLNRVLGLAPQRSLPPFATSLYRWLSGRNAVADPQPAITNPQSPRVVLYADCFTTYNEPQIGQGAVRVLQRLGYEVALPRVGCCGRAMISNGMLAQAIATADRTLGQLGPFVDDDRTRAIVVCEPSCLAAMKDEWLSLRLATPREVRQRLAAKAMLVEEFVERFWDEHPLRPSLGAANGASATFHGHCHQRALWGDQASVAMLRRLLGNRVRVLGSGCCGMAGAFGYTHDHYDVSMRIGEQSLFSLLAEVPRDEVVVAPGTSCRHQIKDGTGRQALHPIQLIDRLLGGS